MYAKLEWGLRGPSLLLRMVPKKAIFLRGLGDHC